MKICWHLPPAAAMAIGCVLGFAGCMSVPAPKNTTEPWTPSARAKAADKSWDTVRAQEQDFSKPLALAELADIALRNNPASRKAWNDARAAAAQVQQARGYFLPTVVGTVGGTRQGLAASPSSNDWDRLQYGPGLQLNYLVFNFGGGRAAAVEQALQTVFAANYTFNKSIQDVILSVETAYYNLVAAKAGIEAVQANLKDAALALDTARERANAGVGTVLDVLQAQSSYDRALYDQATVKGLLKTDRGNLAQVLGFSADAPVDVEPPAAEAPLALSAKDMQGLIDAALQRRPDLAALRANVAAKRAAITVAGSTFWPSLYLTGQVNRDYYNNYDGEYFDNDWSYSAGLNLQWTLFDGLQTLYAKRAAAAQAESAQAQLVQAELAASADVWTSYADLETALEKCHASAAYLKSTSASYDLALDSYRNGLKSMLDVINAENDLAQARKQMIVSRQDAYLALAKLAYATGLLEKGGSLKLKDVFLTPVRKDQP